MQDVVLTVCRDEADIISSFIHFYLEMGFDSVYVIDNGSTDGTVEIVSHLITAGLPVFLWQDLRLGYERYLNEHYRKVGRCADARWLFFLDADEFILFPAGAKHVFNSLPPEINCLRLQQKEMYPRLDEPKRSGEFLLTTRGEPRFNETTKDVTRFDETAKVFAGKHLIQVRDKKSFTPKTIFIRHYKFREPQQALRKERNKVQSHAVYSNDELGELSAFGVDDSRRWFEQCRKNEASEAWREYFSPNISAATDGGLAQWARDFIDKLNDGSLTKTHALLPSAKKEFCTDETSA